jgi:GDPmannose 4,6-dehydratase
MKAIIFGVNGQDGYYLSQLLEKKNIKVIGVAPSGKNCIKGDVSNIKFVENLIKKYKPQYIFHLAAISSTSHNFLFDNHKIICTGSLNILESSRIYCPDTKIFLSGSAMQFKNIGKPINEKNIFDASSAYSLARIHSTYAARYYRNKFKMKIYIGFFFNHDSPLRTEQHINKRIIESVKRIKNGSEEKIEIGDLEAKKEFNFAGDIVEAIWRLINQEKIYEVVIGSGKAYGIKYFIEYCFKKTRKNWKDYVIIKHDFSPEYKILVSDPKLIKSMGWKPKTNFDQLVKMMLRDN